MHKMGIRSNELHRPCGHGRLAFQLSLSGRRLSSAGMRSKGTHLQNANGPILFSFGCDPRKRSHPKLNPNRGTDKKHGKQAHTAAEEDELNRRGVNAYEGVIPKALKLAQFHTKTEIVMGSLPTGHAGLLEAISTRKNSGFDRLNPTTTFKSE